MNPSIQVAIDCADPKRLAEFWMDVLCYEQWKVDRPDDEWIVIVDPERRRPSILFHRVPEPKVVKNRVHLDLRVCPRDTPDDVRSRAVDAEAIRLVGIGATHVRTDDDDDDYYAVMQDPEGNEFCVG